MWGVLALSAVLGALIGAHPVQAAPDRQPQEVRLLFLEVDFGGDVDSETARTLGELVTAELARVKGLGLLTQADLAAASALSVLDYLGELDWDSEPAARDWYARIKSRPSFRSLLADKVPGLPPASHYTDLDF